MPLRGDQRALLQLLCERGQSYKDISELLGAEPDEVRENARAALEEIGGADPDADVGLTDFLTGQADPIGRADAARFLQSNPKTLELAKRIEAGLLLIAPEAKLPKLPEPRNKRAKAAMPAAGEAPPQSPGTTARPITRDSESGSNQGRLIAIIAGIGVILIVAILAFAGVFSNEDDSSSSSDPAASGDTTSTTAEDDTRNVTTVDLKPSDGSGVAGSAKFGIVNSSQLFVDVDLNGLPATKNDEVLLVWLMVGDSGGYPLNNPVETPITPDQNGSFSGSLAVPSQIAAAVGAQATAVKVSSSNLGELRDAVRQGAKQNVPIIGFVGPELASGDIPLATDSQSGDPGGG